MSTLGKYYALDIGTCHFIYLLGELRLAAHKFKQMLFVGFPIGDGLACHTALNGRLCHSGRNLYKQTGVNGFGDEIVAAESKVVYMIYLVHNLGNRLFCQVGNGTYCRQLHLLVYGHGSGVERAAEDIGETYYIVYLVGIVGTAGAHKHIGATVHGILVCNLGGGIGKCKYYGVFCH